MMGFSHVPRLQKALPLSDPVSKQFIHDQALYRLELNRKDRENVRKFLKLERLPDHGLDVPESLLDKDKETDKKFRSRWKRIPGRRIDALKLPDRSQRQLLCITASGGIGKSKAINQLAAIRHHENSGHMVIRVHFSDIPDSIEGFLGNEVLPFLVGRVLDGFSDMGDLGQPRLPADDIKRAMLIRSWLLSLLRGGDLTLAVDGLDEVPKSEGLKKATALRSLIDRYGQLHCVVGGRPNAITESYWTQLFATNNDFSDGDTTSPWEYWLAGMFDSDQRRLSLGNTRCDQLQLLQGSIEFNPRTLDVLRTLSPDVFGKLRSAADAYWHSIHESLQLDSKKPGLPRQTGLNEKEILNILAAIAITMLMWKHDPLAPRRKTRNPRAKSKPRPDIPSAEPTGQVSHGELSAFNELVYRRLEMVYPKWKANDHAIAKSKLDQLKQLNTNFLEISYLIESEQSLQWRNVTQRDFFAALWMVRHASEDETTWFHQRQSSVLQRATEASRHKEIESAWRFVCGMPDKAMVDHDDCDKEECWLACVDGLFRRDQVHSRSNELMFLAWPNLLRRAGVLEEEAWLESDLESARDRALTERPAEGNVWAFQIVDEFLKEYEALKNDAGSKTIIFEDLEGAWCSCDSFAGKEFLCGHEAESDNQPDTRTLIRGFDLCAYQVTNRLYGLFDSEHSKRFDDYSDYSPESRCPAIYISFFDAKMFSIWSGSVLPTEWEWEYAFRAGFVNPDGSQPKYLNGDDFDALHSRAWLGRNSGRRNHKVGHQSEAGHKPSAESPDTRNGFDLYDMMGNVWEWCSNRYGADSVSRSCRGASFASNSVISARCSYRLHGVPTSADHYIGFRVARARKS